MTTLHVTGDVQEFVVAARSYLAGDPVANSVPLTVLAQLHDGHPFGEPPRFAWLTDDGRDVVATASWTPPFHVCLATADISHAAALAPAFPDANGVLGQTDAAHAFAAVMARPSVLQRSERQYLMDRPVAAKVPPGTPRAIKGEADVAVATAWFEAFVAEAAAPGRDHRGAISYRLRSGGAVWFWERDGEPVSLVGRHATIAGVARIGPVYTPPEHRRHGYAGALTAAVSSHALDNGASALTLFTDIANPTSNGVYRRIGFREIRTFVNLRFDDVTAGSGSGR
jgi:RimJ/RimL family protein N-acetyltransferase